MPYFLAVGDEHQGLFVCFLFLFISLLLFCEGWCSEKHVEDEFPTDNEEVKMAA